MHDMHQPVKRGTVTGKIMVGDKRHTMTAIGGVYGGDRLVTAMVSCGMKAIPARTSGEIAKASAVAMDETKKRVQEYTLPLSPPHLASMVTRNPQPAR